MSVTLHPTTSVGFHRPLTQETKSSLIITNCNALPIAFKVLTNAGLRSYVVRPNLGRVEPGGSVEVVVTLQPKDEDPPPDSKCKDKFLIKSTMITREKEEMSVPDIWAAPGSSDAASKVHLQKLRVVYLPPAKDRSPPEAARSVAHSISTIQSHTSGARQRTKAAKDAAQQLLKQEPERPLTTYSEYSVVRTESFKQHDHDIVLDVVGKLASTTLGSSIINKVTLDVISELLALPEHLIASNGIMSDVEPLLDVILERLCNDSLVNLGVSDANQKARTLILKLITMTNVIPRSLFIVQVESEIGFGAISIGSVLKGKYRGRPVTLKVLSTGRYQESSRQIDLCKEAVTWKSVSHRFILPLLGIYEEKPLLFIVFPFMVNGTLTRWRRDRQRPDVAEIHRIMLEVATAVQYLHSEGVFHGDLNGDNILLDSGFHCQITNFGLSRHCFCQPECGEWHAQQRCKTMKMDVYAFGSLYYAIFFNTVQDSQSPGSVASRARPDRLRSPKMEDDTWNLIQSCWKSQPSERPTMEEIAKTLTQRPKTTRRISLITKISSRFLRL